MPLDPRALLRSLRARLLLALLLPMAAVVAAGAVLDWRAANRLAGQSHDRALASTAIGLSARLETDRDGDLPAHLLAMMNVVGRSNRADHLYYLVQDARGRTISGDASLGSLAGALGSPAAINPAFLDTQVGGEPVRAAVYAYHGPDGDATIVVAETLHQRDAQVRKAVTASVSTNLVTALAVAVTAVLAVGFALRPLLHLGQRVQSHSTRDLRPLRLRSVPTEIMPLARALNRLMRRLRRTVQARQAFINSTAHQLRTPLAGLDAQAQLLAAQALPPEAAARVLDMSQAITRLAHMVKQLLWLARADEDALGRVPLQPLELPEVLQQVASSCLDTALARDVDLGFEPQPAQVQGSAWMLHELLANLVTNAINHTPRGSVVTVRCGLDGHAAPRPFVEVEDNGPGIAPEDRERVFGRFVRLADDDKGDSTGSGLGLAIVREIAQHHGAHIVLGPPAHGSGLRVRVVFPPGT